MVIEDFLNQVFLQFSFQLMVCEAVFLFKKPRRNHFCFRSIVGGALYFSSAYIWCYFMTPLRDISPFWGVCFYLALAGMTTVLILFCFRVSAIELLFIVTSGYATEHIAFTLARVIQFTAHLTREDIGVMLNTIVFRYMIYLLVASVVYFLIVSRNRDKIEFDEIDFRIVVLSLTLLVAAIVLSSLYKDDAVTYLTWGVCPIYGMLCCILVLFLEYYVFRENRMKREQQVMEQLLYITESQRKNTKEAIDIINMKCHDLKHQIKALATMQDETARSRYMDEVQEAVSVYDATYHTGCEALDYVLQEKTLLANQYHVTFTCMADGNAICFLHSGDIYALMGNALDNALERVIREPEEYRIISLQIRRVGEMVLIHLENSCSEPPEFEDGLPITDKADKNAHGFGVKSIRYITEKYNGTFCMKGQDGKFYLDILLLEQSETRG